MKVCVFGLDEPLDYNEIVQSIKIKALDIVSGVRNYRLTIF